MTRSVPEWIGKTDDERPPERVRIRNFDAYDGRCYVTKRKIRPGDVWQTDHIKAIVNGGQNRESNLAPILTSAHREKTAADVAEKSYVRSVRGTHIGARRDEPGRLKSRGFQKKPKKHWRSADELARMEASNVSR